MNTTTQFPVFNPYQKATVEIFVSGCTRKCSQCHNPDLQSFEWGQKLDIEQLVEYLKERETLFSIISISGGDLLCQDVVEAIHLVSTLKLCFPNKELWLFTGAELNECPDWSKILFEKIKTGVYNDSMKQEEFPASSNQKLNTKGVDY
jgi:anaerobic ribonucleoside-triphosphate reductase activating protein